MNRFGFALAVLLPLTGCIVSQEEFYDLQRQTAQLQRDFKHSHETLSNEAGRLKLTTGTLDELHEKLRKSFADTDARIDALEISLNKLRGERENSERDNSRAFQSMAEVFRIQNDSVKQIRADVRKLSDELAFLRQQEAATFANISAEFGRLRSLPRMPVREKKELSQQEKQDAYDKALNFYRTGEYDKAIDAFESFLLYFPADSLSANALYWIGESLYTKKKYQDAIGYFHRIIIDFPNSGKVSAALLKEAYCLEELGMKNEEKGALEELLVRFPYSEEAAPAAKRLKSLNPEQQRGKKEKRR